MTRSPKPSWHVVPGAEVVPGHAVVAHLGGGRRTEVYRCTGGAPDRQVVVKVLRPGRTGDRDVAVLRREAATLAALEHPGFPRLVDVDLDADPAWLAMELVDGPQLSAHVREGGLLDRGQALALLHGIADALDHLHGRRRVHLDVKPTNIVVGTRPALIDLGAARSFERAARARPRLGTISYLAPEQAEPDRFGGPGSPSDVFGLGVTIVRVTTGANPYRVRRRAEGEVDEVALAAEVAARAAELPAPLDAVVTACVALHPAARPTAAEVVADLDAVVPDGRG